MAFSPNKTLLLLDRSLKEQFFSALKVSIPENLMEKADALYAFLQEQKTFTKIEASLREITQMGTEEGIERLMGCMAAKSELPKEFENFSNDVSKAAWFFLNQKKVFADAFLWDGLDHYGCEYSLEGNPDLSKDYFDGESRKTILKIKLQDYFKSEKKAKHCEIKVCQNPSTGNICVSAYFDDHSRSELSFEENEKLEKVPRKPVKELHFLIFPKEKRLALQFNRVRNKKRTELIKIFVENVIEQKFSEAELQKLTLDPLLNEGFHFALPSLGVEYIRIKQLRLEGNAGHRKDQVIFNVKDGDSPRDIHNFIDRIGGFNRSAYSVSQAVIHFKFRDMGKKGSVTVTLTVPNSDNFQDNELHLICRQCLIQSGIMR